MWRRTFYCPLVTSFRQTSRASRFCSTVALHRLERVDPGSANVYEISNGAQFKLQALIQHKSQTQTWIVAWRGSSKDSWQGGHMQATDKEHTFSLQLSDTEVREMVFEDEPLALAAFDSDLPFGTDPRLDPGGPRGENIMSYFPRWPSNILRSLSTKTFHGDACVIFDAEIFFNYLFLNSLSVPLVFPHGAYKLQLNLSDVSAMVNKSVSDCFSVRDVLGSEYSRKTVLPFLSGGRLMGLNDDRMVQLGDDFLSSFEQTLAQPVTLTFTSGHMGLGMGPVAMGNGALVTSVEGQAEAMGVQEGWRLLQVNGVSVQHLDFWTIDEMFEKPPPWKITFATDSGASHLYAIELPTQEVLPAFSAFPSSLPPLSFSSPPSSSSASSSTINSSSSSLAGGCGTGGCGNCSCKKSPVAFTEPGLEIQSRYPLGPFIWQEPFSRLFVGDPGSVTNFHSDLLPQVEICHILSGAKVVGVAPWSHTPELLREYGGSAVASETDEKQISIPAHRKLSAEEKRLLSDPSLSLLLGRPGDILVFSSGAAHFATNGLRGISAALYHGGLTPATIPRLCADPKQLSPFSAEERQGEYENHLTGEELVQEYGGKKSGIAVAQQLRHRLRKHGSAVIGDAARIRYEDCLKAMEVALAAAKMRKPAPAWRQQDDLWVGNLIVRDK